MKTKTIASLLLLGLALSNTAFSASPSAVQISKWIDTTVGKVELSNITQIKLENGEEAYLASAEFPDHGRNFWAGYVLARPALKRAMVLEGFGGQFNKISIVRGYGTTVLVLGSAGSGQGYFEQALHVVTFNGWKARVAHSAKMSNNFGVCGYDMGNSCKGNEVFLNPLDTGRANTVSIVETIVNQEGKDQESLTSTVGAKILSFSIKE